LEIPKLIFQVGGPKIIILAVVGLVGHEIAVAVFFVAIRSITFGVIEPRPDADTPASSLVFAVLGKK
jgi:hypothetical protein